MGELHLEIIVDRLKREHKVEVMQGKLKLLTKKLFKSLLMLKVNLFSNLVVVVNMVTYGLNLNHLNEVRVMSLKMKLLVELFHENIFLRVEKGLDEAINTGVLGGYPVVDFKVTLYDGSYHDVDSSEMAFKIAASMAFKAAMAKASPVLLEPIMKVEVETPEEYMGDVMGDLKFTSWTNFRYGITKVVIKLLLQKFRLAEMFGYTTHLRSMTKGEQVIPWNLNVIEKFQRMFKSTIVEQRNNSHDILHRLLGD